MRNTKKATNTRHARKFTIYQLAKIAMVLKFHKVRLNKIVPRGTIEKMFPRVPSGELFVDRYCPIIHATPRVSDTCKQICQNVATEKYGFQRTPLYYNWHTRQIIDTNEYNELLQMETTFWQALAGIKHNDIEYHYSPYGLSTYLQKLGIKYEVVEQWTGVKTGVTMPTPTYKDVIFVPLDEMKKYLEKRPKNK